MKTEIALLLKEILSRVDPKKPGRPDAAEIRRQLKEKGVADHLIEDAMLLLDVIDHASGGKAKSGTPTRVLSSEEQLDLNPSVVGKLFQLYYLGYMKKEDLETMMTNLLFVPRDFQEDRARDLLASMMGISPAQARFIFDGGMDSAVVH